MRFEWGIAGARTVAADSDVVVWVDVLGVDERPARNQRALAAEGHDYSSPEAAAACAAFTGLRGAVGHLISASTTGKALAESSAAATIEDAVDIDSSTEVAEL